MRTSLLIVSVMSLVAGTPAFAQDAMAPHGAMAPSGAMKTSRATERKIKACNAMSHDAMMKNSGCAKVMKAHPDMMQHDSMMSAGH